ncbi:hypothetical protein SZN_15438 [Streptomyces zinciresistens K42]|uniref:Uncharacterized protein n=1 Tax=Streptomyces zinciresistens K42 TaxID=700597 RepID=G2GC63_9ACTN|nr:hypothetical protein SZN_15438 [Streptomyces zinciresistens K42]
MGEIWEKILTSFSQEAASRSFSACSFSFSF